MDVAGDELAGCTAEEKATYLLAGTNDAYNYTKGQANPQQARDPRDVQGAGRRRRQEVEGEGDRRAEVGDTHRSTRHAMARRGAPRGQRAECVCGVI